MNNTAFYRSLEMLNFLHCSSELANSTLLQEVLESKLHITVTNLKNQTP